MATWETTGFSQPYPSGTRIPARVEIRKITDNKAQETTFEVGESVTITWASGNVATVFFFRGTITHEGVVYPVIQHGSAGTLYVVGTASTTLPQQISSALNAESFTVCFLPGTLIATPSGERKVEELAPGDPVLVKDAGSTPTTWIGRIARRLRSKPGFVRAVPVKWVGRQTVSTSFGPAERLMPVRFASGSLGGGGADPSTA